MKSVLQPPGACIDMQTFPVNSSSCTRIIRYSTGAGIRWPHRCILILAYNQTVEWGSVCIKFRMSSFGSIKYSETTTLENQRTQPCSIHEIIYFQTVRFYKIYPEVSGPRQRRWLKFSMGTCVLD